MFRVVWNPKVHYRVHNSPLRVQISPILALPLRFFKTHLMLSTHLSLSLPSGLFPQISLPTACMFLSSLVHAISR